MKSIYYFIFGLIFVILIATAVVLLLINNAGFKNNPNQTTSQTSNPANMAAQIAKNTQKITLTTAGFEPKVVSIKTGMRVLWTNKSGGKGSVNSDPYPANVLWSFLNLGIFNDGQSMSVTLEKPGTYTYHNQVNPAQTGTIIVK